MRLTTESGEDLWLAYGMNLHPGGTLESTQRAIEETVLPLRDRLGAPGPFGVALRFAGEAVERLWHDDVLRRRFGDALAERELLPFTANGFVVGTFHGGPLKESVYRPSWREEARVTYTVRLAEVMASLRGTGARVSISTLPGSWRAWRERDVERAFAANLVRCARRLHALEHETGTRVVLAVEPEPRCTIETTTELIAFWRGALANEIEEAPWAGRHLGACFDVCHQAVMHEDLGASLRALAQAGVPVAKVQASCALEVPDPNDPAARDALAVFDEPVYLHQVGAPDETGRCRVEEDLPNALHEPAWRDRRPWRVHFHVPVFRETSVPPLRTTRPHLDRVLRAVATGRVTEHLEIETYTWDVLPRAEREAGSGHDLVEALAREYEHVLGVLEAAGARRAS
jgi:hypothetical protein